MYTHMRVHVYVYTYIHICGSIFDMYVYAVLDPILLLSSGRPSASKAMKLGKKGRDVDTFVDKLINEGERVSTLSAGKQSSLAPVKSVPAVQHSR